MAYRSMSTSERNFARSVFQNSINYSQVRVLNDLGLGNRPWCSPPVPGFWYYGLHVGPSAYSSLVSSTGRKRLLIHELTHAWQGQHGVLYVFNSAYHQSVNTILNGGDVAPVYNYAPGASWGSYNVEQQASIVEDWYSPNIGNMQTSDPRWTYITNNIRPGNPYA
jgi:hypothetical protein